MSLVLFFITKRKIFNSIYKKCRVTQYAEEQVAYGINYFMKVSIGDGLFIHIRVHQQEDGDGFDFYSLHETIKHNKATCVFKEGIQNIQLSQIFNFVSFSGDPLTYFNY